MARSGAEDLLDHLLTLLPEGLERGLVKGTSTRQMTRAAGPAGQ